MLPCRFPRLFFCRGARGQSPPLFPLRALRAYVEGDDFERDTERVFRLLDGGLPWVVAFLAGVVVGLCARLI